MARYSLSNTIEVGRPAEVTLNGEVVGVPIYADTTAGVVRVLANDKDGNILIDKRRKSARTRTLRGKVEVFDQDGKPFVLSQDHRYRHDSPFRRRQAIHSRRRWLAAWLRENRTVKKV